MAGKSVNIPDSQNDVITTMSHVLYNFEGVIRAEMPNTAIVYSEELDYESAMKQFLANNNYNQNPLDPLPLFAYNRTVLREVEDKGYSKRAKNTINSLRVGNEALTYAVAYGEFDVQFMYISTSIEATEQFEIVYSSEEGISGTKEITVNMDALGDFKYFTNFHELTEKTINIEDSFYKAIIGSATIRGFYFTFRGSGGIIGSIHNRIIASRDIPNKTIDEIISESDIV